MKINGANNASVVNATAGQQETKQHLEQNVLHGSTVVNETVNPGSAGANLEFSQSTMNGNEITEDQVEKKIRDAVKQANDKIKLSQPMTRCEFTYHNEINRVSIKLVDKDTDKIVKEIPPEKTMKMIEKLWEVAGLLVDEKL